MPLQYIKVDVSDYIATVLMDRPPVNAQNAQIAAKSPLAMRLAKEAQRAFAEKRKPAFKGR